MKRTLPIFGLVLTLVFACSTTHATRRSEPIASATISSVVASAIEQTSVTTVYDPRYVRIAYPGGDVPRERGACTDVIIRSFRSVGVDLQQLVHDDMARDFRSYPQRWGLTRPDSNIDHRRVPNLMVFFTRQQKSLAVTAGAEDYLPGDVVAWDLGGGVTHIGIVTSETDGLSARRLVVHNIGNGARLEDVLFSWKVIGHYRYFS